MVAVRYMYIRPKLTFAVVVVTICKLKSLRKYKMDILLRPTNDDVKPKMLTALQSTDTCRAAARGGEAPCCSDKQLDSVAKQRNAPHSGTKRYDQRTIIIEVKRTMLTALRSNDTRRAALRRTDDYY